MNKIEFGDCRETMRRWAAQGVKAQMCVTSPPYFGLRNYGVDGQIGLEQTPEQYIAAMVEVFRCVRDVMADDGTLWLNIGDSYSVQHVGRRDHGTGAPTSRLGPNKDGLPGGTEIKANGNRLIPGAKPKELLGIPWRVALALQADGWYLRQDIIWAKPNPMPESVRDRCTKAHEYIFLLSKSQRYFFDSEGNKETAVSTHGPGNKRAHKGVEEDPEKHRTRAGFAAYAERQRSKAQSFKREGSKREQAIPGQSVGTHRPDREESSYDVEKRNRRSVWTVATRPYKGAHFATFPPALIEPCILAGSRPDDVVLDPFMGSGTTAAVAMLHGRQYLGCELNPEYGPLQQQRIDETLAALKAPPAKPRKHRQPKPPVEAQQALFV